MLSNLHELSKVDINKYGSKAAYLGELTRMGVLIPRGYAISADVYSNFLAFNKFAFAAEDYLSQNENIIDFIAKGSFPERITAALQQYFERLKAQTGGRPFAVRSSALCEDSRNFSMAGVFSSFISLNSFSDLLDSIKKCYASLFSDKALSMIARHNVPLKEMKMGVIVQEFIEGNLSGVAFSADTVKMNPDVIVLSAVNGICADYVGGKRLSSQYSVNKANGEVIDSSVQQQTPVMTVKELSKLHKEIVSIENSLGNYQDIEWTICDSEPYILQARPITTFRSRSHPDNWFIYSDTNDTLMLSEDKALTPLQQDIMKSWFAATCKGWDYSSKGRNGRFKICNGYFFQAVDERDWDKRARFREWLEELYTEGKNIFQDIQLPQIILLREELKKLFARELTSGELMNILSKAIKLFELSVEINMSAVDGSTIPLEAFEKYCVGIDSDFTKDDFYDLIYGISKLSEEREAAIKLALLVKDNADLLRLFDIDEYDEILYCHLKNLKVGNELLEGIDGFLQEYGTMAVNGQWQFDSPILLEQPCAVIGKIRACLDIDSELFFESRKNSIRNKELIIKRLTSDMNENEKVDFLTRLKGAEKAFLVNDDHCFYLDLSGFGYLRLAIKEIGGLFMHMGTIEKEEDTDYLYLDEIKDILEMISNGVSGIIYRDAVKQRKTEYKKQRQVIPPAYIGINPVSRTMEESHESKEDSTILKGISGLQKKVSGKVKIITDNVNIRLQEPSILVLKHGHGCYFLPFLNNIKGLVYDGGSPYDHPGIIAREFSIPSLYNTRNATSVLKDGDEVELDGINGCVILKGKKGA